MNEEIDRALGKVSTIITPPVVGTSLKGVESWKEFERAVRVRKTLNYVCHDDYETIMGMLMNSIRLALEC